MHSWTLQVLSWRVTSATPGIAKQSWPIGELSLRGVWQPPPTSKGGTQQKSPPLGLAANRRIALEICPGVNTFISPEIPAVGTGRSAGREPNVARHPLFPQRFREPPHGIAQAAYEVASLTAKNRFGRLATTGAPLRAEPVRAVETTNVARSALTNSIFGVIACFSSVALDRKVSQATLW